jgi:Glycosyltransferase family 87
VRAVTSAQEDALRNGHQPEPGSPAAAGRGWLVALLAAFAVYAAAVALLSSSVVQRPWAVIAAPSYATAALAAATWKRRGADLALLISVSGGLLAPLAWLAAHGLTEREVNVIAFGAWRLIHRGTPYRSMATLAGTSNPDAYNPYLPAMQVLALARAIWGNHLLTDPRIYFTAAFAVVFWLALRVTGTPAPGRWTALVIATPVVAFPLAVGGDDVPVLALMCLGLALLAQPDRTPSPVLAGLVLGIAAAMKATAWPALIVAAVLLAARDGRRVTGRFAAAALATAAVLIGPVAAVSPAALNENTILFPLGLASVKSGATSPLPGFLLASAGHTGHLIATGLLALGGLAVALSLAVWPPRTIAAATWRLIIGLVVMFTLAPSTRFGYYIYPLGLWVWLRVSQRAGEWPGPPAPGRSRARRAADWLLVRAPVTGAAHGDRRIPLCG